MASFNIEEYLNSLPDDIEEINISNKNLTYIPSLSRFIKLRILYCDSNKLINLPNLPNTLEQLYCSNN
jgi:Leucine-rich repeat (LRR) protein